MTKKATAPRAAASAAAPAASAKPKLHQPTPRRPRDEYTGIGGQYKRDPATGKRVPVAPPADPAATPAAAPAEGGDTPSAAA